MAGLAKDTAVKPRRRQRRARGAQRLASALARRASRGRPGGVIASPRALQSINPMPFRQKPELPSGLHPTRGSMQFLH